VLAIHHERSRQLRAHVDQRRAREGARERLHALPGKVYSGNTPARNRTPRALRTRTAAQSTTARTSALRTTAPASTSASAQTRWAWARSTASSCVAATPPVRPSARATRAARHPGVRLLSHRRQVHDVHGGHLLHRARGRGRGQGRFLCLQQSGKYTAATRAPRTSPPHLPEEERRLRCNSGRRNGRLGRRSGGTAGGAAGGTAAVMAPAQRRWHATSHTVTSGGCNSSGSTPTEGGSSSPPPQSSSA